jgi:hypothetical protein
MGTIEILDAKMIRTMSRGHYKIVFEFVYDNDVYDAFIRTTDSELFDNQDRTVDDLLEHIGGIDKLIDYV